MAPKHKKITPRVRQRTDRTFLEEDYCRTHRWPVERWHIRRGIEIIIELSGSRAFAKP
jgi:hypothetical protein